jgi:hypothetical protein
MILSFKEKESQLPHWPDPQRSVLKRTPLNFAHLHFFFVSIADGTLSASSRFLFVEKVAALVEGKTEIQKR